MLVINDDDAERDDDDDDDDDSNDAHENIIPRCILSVCVCKRKQHIFHYAELKDQKCTNIQT